MFYSSFFKCCTFLKRSVWLFVKPTFETENKSQIKSQSNYKDEHIRYLSCNRDGPTTELVSKIIITWENKISIEIPTSKMWLITIYTGSHFWSNQLLILVWSVLQNVLDLSSWRISLANLLFCRGPSIMSMILFHVTGVGSVSNQLCNISDIFTRSLHWEVDKLFMVPSWTPSNSPRSRHKW